MRRTDRSWLAANERRAAWQRRYWAENKPERSAAIRQGMAESRAFWERVAAQAGSQPIVPGRPRALTSDQEQQARAMLAAGVPVKAVAKRVGQFDPQKPNRIYDISERTIYRLQWAMRREFLLGLAYRLVLWRILAGWPTAFGIQSAADR